MGPALRGSQDTGRCRTLPLGLVLQHLLGLLPCLLTLIVLPVDADVHIGDDRAIVGHPVLQELLVREELVFIVSLLDSPLSSQSCPAAPSLVI